MNPTYFAPVALLALLVNGCQKNDRAIEPTSTTSYASANPNVANTQNIADDQSRNSASTPTEADRDFVNKAAQGGMLEIRLGQAAQTQAVFGGVKSMGQRLAADHSAAYEELKDLATKKGLVLATTLDRSHQKKVDDIAQLSGSTFDKEYSDFMANNHEDEIRLFEKAAASADDADIRAWAAKKLPTLRSHLALSLDAKSSPKNKK